MDAPLQLLIGLVLLCVSIAVILWIKGRQAMEDIQPVRPKANPPEPKPAINMPAPAGLTSQIRELLAQGRKIEAIKLYLEATQAGLKASKDAVEAFGRGEPLVIPTAPPARPSAASGLTNGMTSEMSEVTTHLRQGNKIEAIKAYRRATGAGLKEAKDAVEALERGKPLPAAQPATQPVVILPASMPVSGGDWLAQVKDLLRQGQKIAAVKLYRQATGVGLKEAKDAIDAMEKEL